MNYALKKGLRYMLLSGLLVGAFSFVQAQTRQVRLGDNMGDHVAGKDLDMNGKRVLNAAGIAIGTATVTNTNIALQVDGADKAILIPRVTNLTSIGTPENGMLVYNAADNKFYVYQAGSWVTFANASESVISINGKFGLVALADDGTTVTVNNSGSNIVLSANNSAAIWNANKIQGNEVSSVAPATGQVLGWNGSEWVPTTPADATNAATANTVTDAAQPNITSVGTLTGLTVTAPISGDITGNAGTATKLAAPKTINGVAFDGSADIMISAAADAGTLTGTVLPPNVVSSSLTSVGTLTDLTVTNPIAGSVTGNAATANTVTNAAQPAITSVGTLTGLTVTAPIAGSITGNAATATKLASPRTINGVAFDGSADITISAAANAAAVTSTPTGTVAATNVQAAIAELDGDIALKAPLASPAFTGTVSGITSAMVGLGNVNNTSDIDKPISTATQTALDGKASAADLALKAPLASPTFTGTVSGITAAMVGLGNVNNTSDADKPISSATQTALNAKEPLITAGTAAQYLKGDKTLGILDKAAVGLANVDNTSDADKPISSATQTALDAKASSADLALKAPLASPTFTGMVSGITATMVGLGNVNNTSDADKPISSATQTALDGKASAVDLALKAPLASPTFTGTVSGITATMVGLSNVNNTSDADKPISSATQTALDGKAGAADLALKAPLASPTFTGTVSGITAAMVGLGNVNNTSDADKPISSATQTALNAKEPLITAGTAAQYLKGDKTLGTLDKAAVGLANVDNTSDADKPISSATQTALDGKASAADLALKAPLASPTFTGTVSGITSAMVGLGNVNNTSDADKPVSSATQTALNAKEPLITAGTAAQYLKGDKTLGTLDKAAVGLANVDNTSDADKPVSTVTQTALDAKASAADLALKAPLASPTFTGTVSGITATMVGLSNVNNTSDADKPISSATQTALDGKASAADLALKAPLASPTFTGTVSGITAAMVGLGNVNNTSDADKPISSATQTALDAKASAADLALKAPLASPTFTGIVSGITSAMVGLGNVNNTSDTDKPISSATQTALDAKASAVDLALKAPLASPTFTGTVSGITAGMVGLGNVNNTSDTDKPVSSATQTALDGKASASDLALKAPLASPTFTGTVSGITSAMVGLGNVNNTSDADKPISSATQTALDGKASAVDLALKAPLASPTFTGTVSGITATMVGLGNVNNTGDADKPISSATQTALDGKANVADLALKAPLASPTFTGTVSGITAGMVGLGNVNNTSDTDKPISSAAQIALDGKASAADLALKAPLASPTFTGTVSGITATMVGLGNVNNTSDVDKPVSSATQTALNAKEPLITAGTAAQYLKGDKTLGTLDKAAIGLANVDNTSDADKPVSTATQTALDAKASAADLALKAPLASPTFTGTVSGITAGMVGLGNVNNTSDTDKPISSATQAALDGKASTSNLALKAPLASPTFTGTVSGITAGMVGLGNVNNTSDVDKPVSSATQTALDGKASAADLALKAPLASPTFTGTVSGITSAMVGLGNVNNTSDADKPISSATQTALDGKASAADLALKAPLASPTFTGTVFGITSAMVGLGNVDNTSDVDKPISSATQTALDGKASASDLALKAPLASPTFTGTVSGITATMVGLSNVNNTSDADKPISSATQTALDGKAGAADLALKAPLASPTFTGTVSGITAAMVGLGNVNNTSDADKPISTATQTALNAKEPLIAAGTAAQYLKGDKTLGTLDKTAVGLANVDNTSDADKPVSTATQTALDGKASAADLALKAPLASPTFTGTVSGITAAMVGLGNVNNTSDADKPISSATQTALDGKASAADLALKAPLASPTFTGTVSGITATMVGLGNVNNTNDADKPVSTATQTALDGKASAADLALKAPLASPTFTGTVSGITAAMVGLGNVNNTSDADKPISSATQTALDGKASAADLALKAPLASPTFTGTVSGITATMVGLGNVNNTNDADKPVSTATQTALDGKASAADLALKAPLASPTFTGTVSGITSAMVGLGNVNNTSDADKPISSATQTALDGKASAADLALKAPLASPTFTGTVSGITATMVGLGNVNNTSDADKPISTATQTALNAKEPLITVGTATQYLKGDKTLGTLDKAAVGLANVDNTSDTNKPISTATQTALDGKASAADLALKAPLASPTFTGTVSGITAGMVGLGNVNNTSDADKPISSATQTALDGKASAAALALKASLASPTFTGTVSGITATMVGLGNVNNTNDADKPVSTATQTALDGKASAADLALKAPLASPTFTGTVSGITSAMVGLGNVNNTSDADKPISSATQTALDGKASAADLALKAPLASPTFTGTVSGITSAMVGLGNVNNTSDADKPISTATQTALNAKEPLITAGTATQYLKGDKTLGTLDKAAVGLGNVNNTSDVDKPISSATQTALDGKASAADLALKATLASPTFTGTATSPTFTSTIATGTAPFIVTSTTPVANLSIGGNAATATTVTTNANLTGVVTSVGNTTSIANGAITNAMLANAAVANLSGTNTGDETNATIKTKLGAATASVDGYLTTADYATFNNKAPLVSPSFTTPDIGAATATSVNKLAITAPTTGATLTVADGKTLTASNTLTLAGTDGSTLNIGTGGTLGSNAYSSITYAPLASPNFTGTVTGITAAMVGLDQVNNTSDIDKPISSATQTALDAKASAADLALKAPLLTPTFTNSATAPIFVSTVSTGTAPFTVTSTTPVANLNIGGNAATVTTNANLTGVVTSVGNATSIANGAISNAMLANAAVANLSGTNTGDQDLSALAPKANPTFTGTVTAPTFAGNLTGNAATVTTNANLTGAVTSTGNATSLGSFTSANLSTALSDKTGSGVAVFATSPTLVTPNLGTPTILVGTNITGTAAGLTAGTVTTNANLTGDVTSVGNAATISAATVTGKLLTGFVSGAGTIVATDNILQAINKLDGNDALKAPLASPNFTGTVSMPTPFTLGGTSVTSTGTKLNYLTSASGTTGTASSNLVFSASPTLTGTTTIADAVINHIKGSGTPTGTLGTGSNGGSGETYTINGSDVGGTVQVTTGNANSAASAPVITVNFATPYATAPRAVIITPADATTKALAIANQCYVSATTTGGFTILSGTTRLVLSTTYKWYYMVIE